MQTALVQQNCSDLKPASLSLKREDLRMLNFLSQQRTAGHVDYPAHLRVSKVCCVTVVLSEQGLLVPMMCGCHWHSVLLSRLPSVLGRSRELCSVPARRK